VTSTMTIEEALADLGVTHDTLTPQDRARLDEDGFAVFPTLLDQSSIETLRAHVAALEEAEDAWGANTFERDSGGARVDDINHKGAVFDALWVHPVLLSCMKHYLGDFRLSSMTARAARPGAGHQRMHVDWWGDFEDGYVACNSCWMLDDWTPSSGATRVVPGSHRWKRRPEDQMSDPLERHPDEVLIEAPAGSLAVFNGYLWHSGTKNSTARPRRGLFTVYSRTDQPRQNDQASRLEEEMAQRLSSSARRILDA
jgi:ectoine hydroxylase-related dioxygenase (phytanoyl-CoA dioxygenase family)